MPKPKPHNATEGEISILQRRESLALAIMPERISEAMALLAMEGAGGDCSARSLEAARHNPALSTQGAQKTVAVLPIVGPVIQHSYYTVTTTMIGRAIDALAADPSVGAIVLNIHSPGGSVFGVSELADKIFSARERKPIVAVANSLMASAAYWIGAAAGEVVATPGALVGSVGVIVAHEDYSKYLAELGIKITFITAGKYKAEGNPYEPLTEDATAAMQTMVDEYYAAFVGALAKFRGMSDSAVKTGFGEGRVFSAAQARDRGMVDRVATLEQTIQRLAAEIGASSAVLASAHSMGLLERELEAL